MFQITTLNGRKYKLLLTECQLKLCLVKLNAGVILAHAKQLEISNALYPFLDSDIRVFNIAKGSYQFRVDNIFNSNIPSRLILAMVSFAAFTGTYVHSPYNFKNI